MFNAIQKVKFMLIAIHGFHEALCSMLFMN